MRLRRSFTIKDLAYRFNVTEATMSKVFRSWIKLLSKKLAKLIKWPSKHALILQLPKCFCNYRKCVAIIDCTKISIERPLNLQAQAQTWSSYKNHNIIKYFIAITPVGSVSFLSNGWGGRVSDKILTNACGFLDHLQ